ncbi:hypothetical protein [Arthrobacter gengyunqii]|uniref:Uncharacterized protein n=1 Tax=Arthrobacter gengyunqii TaxID=2886940 RepID=A0ABS8GGV9_9MICC|nr:hypothetical protein [Arthrobacter gengyunqii]MCC3265897.1 hypothetical protein [Arthrobacter gengyunqii]
MNTQIVQVRRFADIAIPVLAAADYQNFPRMGLRQVLGQLEGKAFAAQSELTAINCHFVAALDSRVFD